MSAGISILNPQHAAAGTQADDPRREFRLAAIVGGAFFAGLLGWGALASLDAAAYATGAVKVSGDAQPVQSLEGGVVTAVHVHEGQQVRAGDVLMEFTTAQAVSQERSLAMRVILLEADVARLRAEQSGAGAVTPPPEFATLTDRDRPAADRAMGAARQEFADWQRTYSSEQRLLGERVAQVGNQLQGYQARQDANDEQLRLNRKELVAQQQLLAKGFATETRVLALQRSAADLAGQKGAQTAEMARLRNETGEARMQLLQTRAQAQEQVSSQLRQTQTDLQSLLPQWRAAQEAVARTQLRAPVAGAVMGLVFKGPGRRGLARPEAGRGGAARSLVDRRGAGGAAGRERPEGRPEGAGADHGAAWPQRADAGRADQPRLGRQLHRGTDRAILLHCRGAHSGQGADARGGSGGHPRPDPPRHARAGGGAAPRPIRAGIPHRAARPIAAGARCTSIDRRRDNQRCRDLTLVIPDLIRDPSCGWALLVRWTPDQVRGDERRAVRTRNDHAAWRSTSACSSFARGTHQPWTCGRRRTGSFTLATAPAATLPASMIHTSER